MNRETFIDIIEKNDILWNDIVTITILNRFKKRWEFWKPNILSFYGALNFTYGDTAVSLCVEDPNDEFDTLNLYFNFEEIIGIKKDKNRCKCPKSIRWSLKEIYLENK